MVIVNVLLEVEQPLRTSDIQCPRRCTVSRLVLSLNRQLASLGVHVTLMETTGRLHESQIIITRSVVSATHAIQAEIFPFPVDSNFDTLSAAVISNVLPRPTSYRAIMLEGS